MAFYAEKACKGGHRLVCIECIRKQQKKRYSKNAQKMRAKQREYNLAHPEISRKINLKKKYGITQEHYNLMFEQQGGVCLVCGKPETATYKESVKCLAVDHNHQINKIRGLLCQRCNTALGLLNENPVVIKSLLEYIINANNG